MWDLQKKTHEMEYKIQYVIIHFYENTRTLTFDNRIEYCRLIFKILSLRDFQWNR